MRSVRLPTPLAENNDIKRRLYDLERRLRGLSGSTRPTPFDFALPPFNLNGTLSVSASDELVIPTACKLVLVRGRLKTTGSTTTTAILKQNASTTLATFSFTSGNHGPTTTPTVAVSLVDGDYLWVDVTAAGTSAAGLVISLWANHA